MTSLRFPYTRITRHNVDNPLLKYKNQPLLDVGLSNKTDQMVKAIAYIDTGSQLRFPPRLDSLKKILDLEQF